MTRESARVERRHLAWGTGVVVALSGLLGLALTLAGAASASAQEPGCPPELGALSLALEFRESDAGVEQLGCGYVPAGEGTASRIALIASWVPVGGDPGPSRLCDLRDAETEDGDRWYGFDYSAGRAANVWYEAEDQTLGADRDAVRAFAAALLAEVEALAEACPEADEPPTTTTTTTTAPTTTATTTATTTTTTAPTTTTTTTTATTTTSPSTAEPPPFEVPPDICRSGTYVGQVAGVGGSLDGGFATVVCDFEPSEGEQHFLSPLRLAVRYARPGDPATPSCGLPPMLTESEGIPTGVLYGGTAAVEVTWSVLDPDAGYSEAAMWETAEHGYQVVAAEAAPCPATMGGHDPAAGLPPWAALPPLGPYAPELEWYGETLSCPQTVGGFELTQEQGAWAVGRDHVSFPCQYTRSGVDPEQAASEDRAELRVSWYKANGRSANGCYPLESEFYAYHESRGIEAHFTADDPAEVPAFRDAAEGLIAQVELLAYECPNLNEIVFDPIPPYWQEVFGDIPPPPPIILPDEVTAADVSSGAAYAGADVEGAEAPAPAEPEPEPDATLPAEVDEEPAEETTAADTAPAATTGTADSTMWRVVGIAGLVLSILGLVVAILLVRKQTRVRPRWDYARLVISLVTIVVMMLVIGIDTPIVFIVAGIAVGLVIGVLQGRNLEVRVTARGPYAKRNLIAAVAFAVGLATVQAAGLANRAGIVAIGLSVSFLSAAMVAGLIVGRRRRLADARGVGAGALSVLLGLMLVAGVAVSPPGHAQEQDSAADATRELFIDMVDWDTITVLGGLWAAEGKPTVTISVPRGLAAAPDEITNTVSWEHEGGLDSITSYQLTESYRFQLDDSGACCTVTVVADGTKTPGDREPATFHAEAVFDIYAADAGLYGGITPFRDPNLFITSDPENPLCGRPVASTPPSGAEWTTYTVNGEPRGGGGLELFLLADCDVPEFTVANALAQAPPPPSSAAERMQGGGGPCPVLQELVGPLSEASGLETGSTYMVGRLYTEPNAPACDSTGGDIGLGDFRPGGLQLTLQWSLATDDVDAEAARITEINTDFIGARRQSNIYDEEACELDAKGDILPPADDEECYRSQFFAVGSEMFVFTEYVEDGPNVTIRGRFPWGFYWFYCHHCEPDDPMVRDAIGAFHRAAARPPAGGAPAPAEPEVIAGEDDQVGVIGEAGEELEDVAGLFVDENDIEARDAAVAAIIALIGSAALAGTALAESGIGLGELGEALRRGGEEALPEGIDRTPLRDEDGREVPVDAEGMVEVWNGTEMVRVTRAEGQQIVDALIDERQRIADAEKEARIGAIVSEHESDEAAAARLSDVLVRSEAAEIQRVIAEGDASAERRARAWDMYDRMHDIALRGGDTDVVALLDKESAIFDPETGLLDVEKLDRVREELARRRRTDALIGPLDDRSNAQMLADSFVDAAETVGGTVVGAVDTIGESLVGRIAVGFATGGWSEVYYNGKRIVTKIKAAAEASVDNPDGQAYTTLDGLGDAMMAPVELVPGYATVSTLNDPEAGWSDVGQAVFWDAIGAKMARGELSQARSRLGAGLERARGLVGGRPRVKPPGVPKISAADAQAFAPAHPLRDVPESWGMSKANAAELQRVSQDSLMVTSVRPSNRSSIQRLSEGHRPKIEAVKDKTIGTLDRAMVDRHGNPLFTAGDEGLAARFNPADPPQQMPRHLQGVEIDGQPMTQQRWESGYRDQVAARAATRRQQFRDFDGPDSRNPPRDYDGKPLTLDERGVWRDADGNGFTGDNDLFRRERWDPAGQVGDGTRRGATIYEQLDARDSGALARGEITQQQFQRRQQVRQQVRAQMDQAYMDQLLDPRHPLHSRNLPEGHPAKVPGGAWTMPPGGSVSRIQHDAHMSWDAPPSKQGMKEGIARQHMDPSVGGRGTEQLARFGPEGARTQFDLGPEYIGGGG